MIEHAWGQPAPAEKEGFMSKSSYESEGSHVGTAVTFLLIGLGAGALAGLLLAPKTGKQLRRVREAGDRVREVTDKVKDVASRGAEIAEDLREPLRRAINRG